MAATLLAGLAPAGAQFNSKRPAEGGTASGTATGAAAAATTGAAAHGVTTLRRGEYQDATIVNTGVVEGTTLKYTDLREADLWARAIIHSDGSYTETKKDGPDARSMTQRTYSANGVLLQERVIVADARGNPSEVMIKDAAGQFRYRGVLLYDRANRFVEEQLYDMNNQLLRRRIQEYSASGEPKLRVLEYSKNLPPDIRLIITDEKDAEKAEKNLREFQRLARERPAEPREERPKKKGFLGRLFGGGDD